MTAIANGDNMTGNVFLALYGINEYTDPIIENLGKEQAGE